MTMVAEAAGWDRDLSALMERIAPRFYRVEARRRARSYVAGLLAPLERKCFPTGGGNRSPDGASPRKS